MAADLCAETASVQINSGQKLYFMRKTTFLRGRWVFGHPGALVLLAGAFSSAFAETQAPAFRLFLAPQTVHSDEVTLLWEKPEDARAGARYEVLRDGEPAGETTKTHFTATGLAAKHDYVFTIRARSATAGDARESNALPVHTHDPETVVSVLDHGAIGDGHTLNTQAIQAAIDACPVGGVVRIPAGVFLSGALFLKSDMTLEIAKGGVLKGSAAIADYEPFILNRFEGWEMKTCASLLNAGTLDRHGPANVRNLSIRGAGTLSGGGAALSNAVRSAFPGREGLRSRGRLILLMNAENVEVAGLTLEESPCWTLHYIYSENVSIHGLTIRSDVLNGDGIDPDSSRNSCIFNCSFDTGDDCIAIKSGKNPEGNEVNRPTENVRIVDCRFVRGHGISIGSEISGGVRDVLVEDCTAGELLHGLQIKATKDRGNVVENVTVRDCDLRKISILTALNYNNDGAPAPEQPYFRNFHFSDIDMTAADAASAVILVNGFEAEGHRTRNVIFKNIRLPAGAKVTIDHCEDLVFSDVITTENKKPAYNITQSERVTY
jgi:polygalacturonase